MHSSSSIRALRVLRLPRTPLPTSTSYIRPLGKIQPQAARTVFVQSLPAQRSFHSSPVWRRRKQETPSESDVRGPADIAELDVLGATPVPSTNIEATVPGGFLLNSGLSILGGDGALLVGGEAFAWRPWLAKADSDASDKSKRLRLYNERGQLDIPPEAFSVLGLMWPKPDLLVVGTGPTIRPLSPETRRHIGELGLRVEILDTRNAAAQFNLLATERGVGDVAAALIPVGWVEGKGAVEE
ncbi:hypothetical protein SODALDRAFT_6128 [Sodiomyces alkalinus F11]|uniref:NADH dehydrogenase [ubiquinone] 1 alpha subcomplex assembly factor 3 n=1 Tax=Sodiomyces alkalinus (strain CBS 110278 / VKM F-3762 / F11) TaxID=1314773 RepID=A0A3N2Q5T1_SODAK|nr:hypothetical protein SODALDRAFT_6128 [Sodiomyces alkalinus F11]ROT42056.1 hypothetical protein SODALDRAFT_6128 [Sodiomyces alkalinus F11]